jgi:HTH-type transcriptional regulator / antitoxin HipB
MVSLSPNGAKGDPVRIRSIRDIAAAARGRRLDLGVNQADLARRVGVSRKWLVEFEAGKPSAELGLALRVLDELGLVLDLSIGPDASGEALDLDALLEEHRQR